MKRVYVHNQEKDYKGTRSTFALELPDDFLYKIKENIDAPSQEEISINLGLAICHPTDPYVKSIGREIADGRMDYVWFNATGLIFKPDRICITLDGTDGLYEYFIRVHVYRDTGNIRIIECSYNG